jgi:Fic family protein
MSGRQPHPGDPDWSLSCARATARAAQEAYALAGELSRRSEILLSVAPKLRAKQAARVVDLLLSDDSVSASRAAKTAGLSDRAARRVFDRLVELGAVRELSGRAKFRLYGL